jgi:hypothetical protein
MSSDCLPHQASHAEKMPTCMLARLMSSLMSSDCLPHQASNAEKADLHAELAALASTGMLDGIKKLDREIWELEVPLMTADDP